MNKSQETAPISCESEKKPSWWKEHKTHLQRAATVILVSLIACFLFRIREDLVRLKGLGIKPLLAMFVLHAFGIVLNAARLHILFRRFAPKRIPFAKWLEIFITGRFLNNFFTQGGNIYRTVTLKMHYGLTHTNYIGCFLTFTWLDSIINFTLSGILVLCMSPGLQIGGCNAGLLILILVLAAFTGPLLIYILTRKARYQHPWLQKIHEKLELLFSCCKQIVTDMKLLLLFMLFGIASFAVMVSAMGISFYAIGEKIRIPELVLLYALYKISLYVMLTPGNLGVRELSFAAVCKLTQIEISVGLMVSIIVRLTHYLTMIVLIAIYQIIKWFCRIYKKSPAPEESSAGLP